MELLDRVAETTLRYSMFARGQKVGVAVSGGADSVALLHILREFAPHWGITLGVLHLDHGLRGDESRGDAAFVKDLADQFGLPLILKRVNLPRLHQRVGGNLEDLARRVRGRLFRRAIAAGAFDRIAVAHTADDQAETVLFRILRGAGSTGLAGILPVTGEGIVRPLILARREEVRAFLAARGHPWREDSSNLDPRFARNRIRNDLLPRLTTEWNPNLGERLAHLALLAQEDEQYWRGEVERRWRSAARETPAGVVLSADALLASPIALSRRLIRRGIELAKGNLHQVDFQHVESVWQMVRGPEGRGEVNLPGLEVSRSFNQIRLARRGERSAERYQVSVEGPGEVRLENGRSRFRFELSEQDSAPAEGDLLDAAKVAFPLTLRSWRPGDRYQPVGCRRPEKLKTLFQLSRVPSWERAGWPIVEYQGAIAWTRQFGPAERFAPGPDSKEVVRIVEL